MNLLATIRLALRALARSKMRSALTMLGIIIGVAAVIAMVAIGQGADKQIQDQIAAMGSNMLFVMSGSMNKGGMHMGSGNTKTLIEADVDAIKRECPAVADASGGEQTGIQVVFGNDNWGTQVNGVEPSYFAIRNWTLASGSFFDRAAFDQAANVVVLGDSVKKNLFGTADPVGSIVRIKNLPFKVIGVTAPKGASSQMGGDQDDTTFIPLTTYQKKITGDTWLRWVVVSAVSQQASTEAQRQITELLRDRHRIRPGQDDDFVVRNLKDFADSAAQASQVMTVLLASIAGVSLLVGGIGIMNIMLVSVTERTREIGIRIAIGATERDVQSQFLLEAFILSLIGGIIGIITGIGSSFIISSQFKWPVLISGWSIIIAAIFSMAIGIVFGFFPAFKASRLDPIDALRYE